MYNNSERTPPFSVLIATYRGDDAYHLDVALESIFTQSLPPNEVLIVEDGPLTSKLREVINRWQSEYPEQLTTVSLEQNSGLGEALQVGVEACSHNLIARMDSDDIAVSDRFERQITYLVDNPQIDVLGGYVGEFDSSPNDISNIRTVPANPEEIRRVSRYRCPMNHPTVVFRRDAVLSVGNYSDRQSMQDYELWVKMLNNGLMLANIPEIMVKMRRGGSLFKRRGGLSYLRTEIDLFAEFRSIGFINMKELAKNLAIRTPVRLLPTKARALLYQRVLRSPSIGDKAP